MKASQLRAMGVPAGIGVDAALAGVKKAMQSGMDGKGLEQTIGAVLNAPQQYAKDPLWGDLAQAVTKIAEAQARFSGRQEPAPWKQWGVDLETAAITQMERACQLPVAVAGALMPDAHVGYGLPIGGVLATRDAVIPYAVGVDIACRMKMTVLDLPVSDIVDRREHLIWALEEETRFGVGSAFKTLRQHDVMDDPAWDEMAVLHEVRDKAASQLGTSGGGNHFAEFGELEVFSNAMGIAPGKYVALLSHSGSRGTGEHVAKHYSNLAREMHPELPEELTHLAWLDMGSNEGREYWRAMELMGRYSAANHELIHTHVVQALGCAVLAEVENHHNFAWKEKLHGREVIVHRKGATPASEGVMGVIPGSMGTSGYVVRGRGSVEGLNSASHGAGRAMSRVKAKECFTWDQAREFLKQRKVHLISAGLDEVPMAYKDIEEVMAAQQDLVEQVARFDPRLVKMAPGGKRSGRRRKWAKSKQK